MGNRLRNNGNKPQGPAPNVSPLQVVLASHQILIELVKRVDCLLAAVDALLIREGVEKKPEAKNEMIPTDPKEDE